MTASQRKTTKTVRIREVGANHYAVEGVDGERYRRLPGPAKRFFRRWELGQTDHAVIVTEAGTLVGVLRFYLYGGRRRRYMVAYGTWVADSMRRRGIAKRMWMKVLRDYKIENVDVVAVSKAGRGFISEMIKEARREGTKVVFT